MTSYSKESPPSIQAMFASIAKEYDKTNAILSLNMHRYWNNQLVQLTAEKSGSVLLDLCAGTGEITQTWIKHDPTLQKAYLLDFCPQMLEIAQEKMSHSKVRLHFIQGNAESIPLENESIDAITIAYGVRNIHCIDNCFKEAKRVLKPGGVLGILELTSPTSKWLMPLHQFYLQNILPRLGGFVTKNEKAYQYLCQSIQNFIKPYEIKDHLKQLNFNEVTIHPLSFGIATVITAKV